MKRSIRHAALLVALAVSPIGLVGCGQPTISTPAPPKQSLDLTIARSLLDAQTAIEKAKGLVATTPALKDPLNRVIAGYNAAFDAYQLYHQAVIAGGTPDATALQAQIAALAGAVVQLRGMFQ